MKWFEQPLVISKFAKVVGSANISLKTGVLKQTKKLVNFNFLKTLQPDTPTLQHSALSSVRHSNVHAKGTWPSSTTDWYLAFHFQDVMCSTFLLLVASPHNWSFVPWAKRQISFQLLFHHCYWCRAQTRERDRAAENDPVAHTTYFVAIFLLMFTSWNCQNVC